MPRPETRLLFARAVTAAALAVSPMIAGAQAWPARPVTIIVPNPAGGPPDVLARVLSAELGSKLARPFVIENRGGGSGNIGSAAVAKAQPDGYTLLLTTTGPAAINRIIFKDLAYDPERDLAPVGLLTKSALIAVASLGSPMKDVKELVAYAKANPGKLNVGIPGNGTIGHLTSELLQQTAGMKMTHVPYRGAAPLINDLLGGQLDMSFGFITGYLPLLKEGKIRPLAVTGSKRSEKLPAVPTLQELGFRNFEATAWYALFAPAKTPPEVIEKLNSLVNAYMQTDRGRQQLADLDMEPIGGSPDEVPRFIASEIAKWGPVVKALNIAP
jgi:tripartite-type tricarboxylate transporter receptor subunit TctC